MLFHATLLLSLAFLPGLIDASFPADMISDIYMNHFHSPFWAIDNVQVLESEVGSLEHRGNERVRKCNQRGEEQLALVSAHAAYAVCYFDGQRDSNSVYKPISSEERPEFEHNINAQYENVQGILGKLRAAFQNLTKIYNEQRSNPKSAFVLDSTLAEKYKAFIDGFRDHLLKNEVFHPRKSTRRQPQASLTSSTSAQSGRGGR